MWLTYDAKYVYLAVHAEEPAEVHATEYRVNASLGSEDHVTLRLDFSGTLADFNTFSINPIGATSLSLAGGRAAKREWIGDFVAKGHVFKGGYEIEARIPWELMHRGKAGNSDLRIDLFRYHQHSQRSDAMAFTSNNLNSNTAYWLGVDLPRERTIQTLKLLPYAYGGWDKDTGRISDAGLDLKMPVTDKIELVGSVNPDFKNIENQLLSLDFSRFERLSGEVRPFFLEGRSYLNTALFASQRIDRFDAGVNAYGKINDKTSFALLDTWLDHKEEDLVFNVTNNPSTNDQYRFSYASQNRPDVKNDAFLARYYRTFGPWTAFVREMGTKDLDSGYGGNHYGFVSYQKTPLFVMADYSFVDPEFNTRLGFTPEVDYKGPTLFVDHNQLYDKGPFASVDLNGGTTDYRHVDGSFYRSERTISVSAQHRASRLQVSGSADWADFEGQRDRVLNANLFWPYNDSYRNVYAGVSEGTAALLPYRNWSFGGRYRTLRNKLDLSLSGQIVEYQGYSDQVILSASYDLGNDQSISGRVVKSGSQLGPYIAYRRAGNRGAEYFLLVGNPNTQQFQTSIVLKVTIPFEVPLRR